MLAVLGPRSINERKFTPWATRSTALGLEWDTERRTVSMPVAKIAKALGRVRDMLQLPTTSRTVLGQLLGSLRHVCSCIRPARPFFQWLASLYRRAPRAGKAHVSFEARLDLLWFEHILVHGHHRSVPLAMFAELPEPDVHIYMDASDVGLCALNPARTQYLRIQFDAEERHKMKQGLFPINVREQLSTALAVLCWGSTWLPSADYALTHVRVWIDNRAAVSWCNTLASHSGHSQELNRVIGAVEARYGLRVSAEHLPGATNFMADLGSRPRPSPDPQDLYDHLVALQLRSLADSSRRQYDSTWKQWTEFCNNVGVSEWLPADRPQTQSLLLALFAVHCWRGDAQRRGIAAAPVQSKLSHVRWRHRIYAGHDPQLLPGHDLALRGMRRASQPPQSRQPVTQAMLEWIIKSLDLRKAQHRLVGGTALLGFFFLLRSAEYLAIKGRVRMYTLQVQDVIVLDAHGKTAHSTQSAQTVIVHFRGSKTDQDGHGIVRSLKRSGHPHLCPVYGAVLLLQHAVSIGLQPRDLICSSSPTHVLRAEIIAKIIKSAAASTGDSPKWYSCHSLRSGGTTALLESGVDSTIVMLHGRWRSEVFQRYTRLTEKTSSSLSECMTSGAS